MDDIGKYLTDMDRHKFWKLVRQYCPWLTRQEAAAYLHVSVRCLEVWSAQGKGPTAVFKGRLVRYHIDALNAYMRGSALAVERDRLGSVEPVVTDGSHEH